MELTSKQRAKLRSIASTEDTIFQIGKNGIGDILIQQLGDALKKRELIKVRVLDASLLDPKEAAVELAQATSAIVVQVMGTRITLYKRNEKDPVIEL